MKKPEKKKFTVAFSYDMTGTVDVIAASQKEAEKIVEDKLSYYGIEGFDEIDLEIDHTSREWEIL